MFRFALTFAFVLYPLSAADLSGTWPAKFSNENGLNLPLHLEFVQSGSELAGASGTRSDFLSPLQNVRLAGNTLTFDLQMAMKGAARFEGVFEGDHASGRLTSKAPALCGKLEMKRTGPPARLPASFTPPAGGDDLAALSDEFDNPDSLKNWRTLSDAEQWPDHIEKMDVNKTSAGHLHVVPRSGAWWAGYHGVYLFKEVKGDFVITTRVKVTGKSGGEPANIWTISGLLVRAPGNLETPREQRKENWIYVMTGRGPADGRVVDAKSTLDGNNAWDITPAQAGWYDLRIARIGPLFVAMCRPDGGDWVLRKRIFRGDLPETLQAGINVTSDFAVSASMTPAKYNAGLFPDRSNPDSITLFDFVRFSSVARKPGVQKLAGKEVAGIRDEDLLALFQ